MSKIIKSFLSLLMAFSVMVVHFNQEIKTVDAQNGCAAYELAWVNDAGGFDTVACYETFEQAGFDMQQISHWYPKKEKYHIDLPAANRLQLLAEGVPEEQIHDSAICTYTQHEDFFSARRLGIRSGRILNGIVIR